MNLYDQYLALLQLFFHRQDRQKHQEKQTAAIAASDKQLFRDAA